MLEKTKLNFLIILIAILILAVVVYPYILGMAGRTCISPEDNRELTSSATLCTSSYYLRDAGTGAIRISGDDVSLDCNGAELVSDGKGKGIVITGNNTEVKNCIIKDYDIAIYILDVSDMKLTNNIIKGAEQGVHATQTNSLTILNTTINDSEEDGIYLYEISDSKIDSNKVIGGKQGIHLVHNTDYVTISNNNISGCIDAIFIDTSFENTVCYNDMEDSSRGVVAKNVVGLKLFNNSISGNDVSGIGLFNVHDSEFIANMISSNKDGILMSDSYNNNFFVNYIRDSQDTGITLGDTSKDNTFHHNAFINNPMHVSATPIRNNFHIIVNETSQGNYWDDIASLAIIDINNDSYGDSGKDHPYKSRKVGLGVVDEGPIISEDIIKEQNITVPIGCEYKAGPKGAITKSVEIINATETPQEKPRLLARFAGWLKIFFS